MGRFEKYYLDKETYMIEGEARYYAKLLSLLRITEFTMKGLKTLSSSLNPKYTAPYNGDNN